MRKPDFQSSIVLRLAVSLGLAAFFAGQGAAASIRLGGDSIFPNSSINNHTSITISVTNESDIDIRIYQITANARILVRNLERGRAGSNSSLEEKWDGRNDNGEIVQNGTYEIEATISDAAKPFRKTVLKKEVRVETQYIIEELTVTPMPFIPRVESATVLYRISKDAAVTIDILDGKGSQVGYILKNKSAKKGKNSVSWNGKAQDGRVLSSGNYTCRMEAFYNGVRETRKFGFRIGEEIRISDLLISPERFNPEGINNFVLISFVLEKKVDYNVKICDRSGKEVWDSGRVEGKSGRNSIAWGGLRRVDFQTDIYYNIGIERKENKESGKGRQTVKYKETINESRDGYDLRYTGEGKPVLYSEIKTGDISLPIAKAEEKLKGVEGDVVETRIDDIQIKYSSIKPQSLLSGNYTVEVRVKDPESKEVKSPLNATVTIDLEKSFLIIVDDNDIKGISERNEFYPKEISSSSVKRFSEVVVPFRITADANVTVQIVSRKGGIEREINMGRILSGNAEARWDGMNKDAGFVPEGQYEMKILATDTTVLKNQKTIEYSLPVYVRKIPRVLAVKYRGTDEFYAFNLEKDYRFISPIISTRDVFDRLTNELGPDEAKEGEISIDFEFSEPVVLSFAVMSEDRMNKTQKVFRKDEWADLKYSDEKNVYAWSWNGEKIDKNKMAPLYEKYGIAHDDTSAEFIEPGLYQLWLFALPKGRENGKILYGFMNELCGKKERTCEEMQKFIEDNVADKKIIFDKNTIKGLGILTEVGVRMEGVVHKGMGEFLNFIKRK